MTYGPRSSYRPLDRQTVFRQDESCKGGLRQGLHNVKVREDTRGGKCTSVTRWHGWWIVFSHVKVSTKVQVRKWETVRSLTLSITVSFAYAKRTTSKDVGSVIQDQRSNQTESEFVPFINIIVLGEQRWPSLYCASFWFWGIRILWAVWTIWLSNAHHSWIWGHQIIVSSLDNWSIWTHHWSSFVQWSHRIAEHRGAT